MTHAMPAFDTLKYVESLQAADYASRISTAQTGRPKKG